jgi:hypothetical protein
LGESPTDARDRRGMALEVERPPARADRLYARGLSGPNRAGGSVTISAPGLPENAP